MLEACKRLRIYFKEMYPIVPRLFLGALVFLEIHFIVLLNHGVTSFDLGIQEIVCAFTVFSFLCWLRIADDFKDYELDCRLFAERPLPSGRVKKKDLAVFVSILIAFTLYFPALIWEVSRKIRAPEDETEYVTYSKLFGYKKATDFVLFVTWVDIITNFILVWALNKVSVLLLLVNVLWMSWKCIEFKQDPSRYKIVEKVERYTYIQESIMILTVAAFLLVGKI